MLMHLDVLCIIGTPYNSRNKGVARTLIMLHTTKETTGSSSDSLQLRPFSKWELLVMERICSQRELILSFKSSS